MKTAARIFKRLNLLCIRFEADGGAVLSVVPHAVDKGASEARPVVEIGKEKNALSKHPLIAVVSGKGVITKDASAAGIVETVTADPETFLWTVANGKLSFTRREQLTAISEELASAGIRPLYTECLPDTDEATLGGTAERFHAEHSGWRRILRPTPEGSQLALLIAKRIRLPVLGALMLALVANFALSGSVRERFQAANIELAALQRSSSAVTASNESRRTLIEGFSRQASYRTSRLSDRIGGAVPDKVALTEIAIAPLSKALEAGKPVQQNANMVVVRGETTYSEAVTEFADALGRLRLGTIRLAAVEQKQERVMDTERTVLTFRIEITM